MTVVHVPHVCRSTSCERCWLSRLIFCFIFVFSYLLLFLLLNYCGLLNLLLLLFLFLYNCCCLYYGTCIAFLNSDNRSIYHSTRFLLFATCLLLHWLKKSILLGFCCIILLSFFAICLGTFDFCGGHLLFFFLQQTLLLLFVLEGLFPLFLLQSHFLHLLVKWVVIVLPLCVFFSLGHLRFLIIVFGLLFGLSVHFSKIK